MFSELDWNNTGSHCLVPLITSFYETLIQGVQVNDFLFRAGLAASP